MTAPADLLDAVRTHYEADIKDQPALFARLEALVDQMPRPLTARSLAALDQFHVGGLAATIELARRVGAGPGLRVLDAGSGLGGPSRYLAEEHGCEIVGVDLSPAYVAVAALLAEKAGLAGRVRYQVGDVSALPFPDGSLDLVWTQHVAMNVPNRARLYREARRVLRTGGRLAFYDPYVPDSGEPPHYPVPWAQEAAASTLLTRAETVAAMERAGLRVGAFDDVTDLGLGWSAQQQALSQALELPAPSLGLVVGPRMAEMVRNFGRNLREGRVRLAMGLAEAR